MVDLGTGLTILGGAIGGAEVAKKILGPSADYVGEQLKQWTEKAHKNLSKIFENGSRKIGDRLNESGQVPPKVLKGILDHGAWCEEDLQVEYFGGVLASSRSGTSRDDRGAYYTSLIARLSTYQLRAHYLAYHSFKKHFNGIAFNVGDSKDRRSMRIFIPFSTFIEALDFTAEELKGFVGLSSHAIWGLNKEDLIEHFQFGPVEHMRTHFEGVSGPGILMCPTILGVELFMWAYGYGQLTMNDFFLSDVTFDDDQNIPIGSSTRVFMDGPHSPLYL